MEKETKLIKGKDADYFKNNRKKTMKKIYKTILVTVGIIIIGGPLLTTALILPVLTGAGIILFYQTYEVLIDTAIININKKITSNDKKEETNLVSSEDVKQTTEILTTKNSSKLTKLHQLKKIYLTHRNSVKESKKEINELEYVKKENNK